MRSKLEMQSRLARLLVLQERGEADSADLQEIEELRNDIKNIGKRLIPPEPMGSNQQQTRQRRPMAAGRPLRGVCGRHRRCARPMISNGCRTAINIRCPILAAITEVLACTNVICRATTSRPGVASAHSWLVVGPPYPRSPAGRSTRGHLRVRLPR